MKNIVKKRRKKIEYNENTYEIHEKENNKNYWSLFLKPENLINLIVVVLTFISVILVWVTLLEMKQQRESAYKPVIAIGNENRFVIKRDGLKSDFYLLGIDFNAVEGSGYKSYGFTIPYLYFTVENIGLGAATNLKFEWSQDICSKFIDYIESMRFYKDLKVIEDGDLKIISSQNEIIFETNWPTYFEITYINSSEKEELKEIDAGILGYLIGLSMLNSEKMPNLQLKISYEDIYGKSYTAVAEINVHSSYLRKDNGAESYATFDIVMEYSE